MKKLGFGLMRLPLLDPNDAGSIDLEQVKKMVDAFIERGFTYFDTAWMYTLQYYHALIMRCDLHCNLSGDLNGYLVG